MYLSKILETQAEEIKARKLGRPWSSLAGEIEEQSTTGRFRQAVAASDFAIVAEFKRASPSKGLLAPDLVVEKVAVDYEKYGAAALSILTERQFFQGSLTDLRTAATIVTIPILMKDFIIDPYQILEAKWAGASAILLIIASLAPGQAEELASCTREMGLDLVVEIYSEEELAQARELKADIIQINNRDLHSFQVSLEVTYRLFPLVGKESLVISASGIKSRKDLLALKKLGVNGVLVGESLVIADDPGKKLSLLLGEKE